MTAADRLDPVGLAAAGVTALAWGLVGTLVREIPTLTPRELVAGRLAFALAASVPACLAARGRDAIGSAVRIPTAWALGALLSMYFLVAVNAFRLAPVAEVALLVATSPVCALGLRRLAGERAEAHEQQGAMLALLGVAMTLVPALRAGRGTPGLVQHPLAHAIGDALALTAAILAAIYALTFRRAERRAVVDGSAMPVPFGVAVLTFVLGCAVLALHAALTGVPYVPAAALDARGWALLALLGVACTFVPTVAFATASRRLPPVLASASLLLVPVVSAAAAAVVLGEVPSAWLLPGGVLVGVGILRLLGVRFGAGAVRA